MNVAISEAGRRQYLFLGGVCRPYRRNAGCGDGLPCEAENEGRESLYVSPQGELRGLIRQGVTSRQIAVIGPASYINSSLARFKDVEEIPFVSEAYAWRRGDGILITTARAFKGLEADIVII